MKTFEELGIFWASPDGHIEVAGIIFYGFWSRSRPPDGALSFAEIWTRVDSELAVQQISLDDGHYIVVPVWIKEWPSDYIWRLAVMGTLNAILAKGATVSWCGGETCSWSLTEFDPKLSSGCVYAASSKRFGMMFYSELSEEIAYLEDGDLLKLQAIISVN